MNVKSRRICRKSFPVLLIGLILITVFTSCNVNGDEESGTMLGLNETYDNTRNGARLILAWDGATGAFTGTVENTTNAVLQDVRVEVHLDNGTELGPTPVVDLAASETTNISLSANGETFTKWSPHVEVKI